MTGLRAATRANRGYGSGLPGRATGGVVGADRTPDRGRPAVHFIRFHNKPPDEQDPPAGDKGSFGSTHMPKGAEMFRSMRRGIASGDLWIADSGLSRPLWRVNDYEARDTAGEFFRIANSIEREGKCQL